VDALTHLALDAARGDRQALDGLVESTYDQVWRLCATVVDEGCADDLAQETFGRAVRALAGFRGDSSARTWLLAIARYTCMDELRARDRRRRLDAVLEADAGGVVEDSSGPSVTADLLGRLEPARRLAFFLTQVLGLSYQEAAEVCGCPAGTIRSRVARARADLLAALDSTASASAQAPVRRKASGH
jgi:RNA polymerase sigma-70 factor (ECF subfamily)